MAPLHSITLPSSLGCLRRCPRFKYIAGWLDFFRERLPVQRKESEGMVELVLCLPFSLTVSLEWAWGWDFQILVKPKWSHRVARNADCTQIVSLWALVAWGILGGTFLSCISWFPSTKWFSAEITWTSNFLFLTLLLSTTYFASEYYWALFFFSCNNSCHRICY